MHFHQEASPLTTPIPFNSPMDTSPILPPSVVDLQAKIAQLESVITQLQSQIPQQPPQPTPPTPSHPPSITPPQQNPFHQFSRGIKVAPPDIYDGSLSKAKTFLSQVMLFIAGKKDEVRDDHDKIILMLSYMKGGTAGPWAEQKVQQYLSSETVSETWLEFLEEFKAVFSDPDPAGTARNKMERLHQGTLTCDEYVSKFRELKVDTGYNDAALVEKFKKGLNQTLVDKIYGLQEMPDDLKGWETWATKFDRQWRQREAEKKATSHTTKSYKPFTSAAPTPKASTNEGKHEPDVVPMEVDSGMKNIRAKLICFKCGKPGHMARNCRPRADIGSLDYEAIKALIKEELQKEKEGF